MKKISIAFDTLCLIYIALTILAYVLFGISILESFFSKNTIQLILLNTTFISLSVYRLTQYFLNYIYPHD